MKYGAKFGKKAAESETGRAAGKAALKAGTEVSVDIIFSLPYYLWFSISMPDLMILRENYVFNRISYIFS